MRNFFFLCLLAVFFRDAHADTVSYGSQTAINMNGAIVAVWQSYDTVLATTAIVAAYSSDGVTWSAPQTISQTNSTCSGPITMIDSAGDAVAVWCVLDSTTGMASLYAAMYTGSSGTWNPYECLGLSNDLFGLKMNSLGDISLTFTDASSGTSLIMSTTADCGTPGWTPPIALSSLTRVHDKK